MIFILGTNLLFPCRDFHSLLPGSLEKLSRTLCSELGSKGNPPHDNIQVSNIMDLGSDIIHNLRQGVHLLGCVLKKAQAIRGSNYEIDVEDVMTVSSLSMPIFTLERHT